MKTRESFNDDLGIKIFNEDGTVNPPPSVHFYRVEGGYRGCWDMSHSMVWNGRFHEMHPDHVHSPFCPEGKP